MKYPGVGTAVWIRKEGKVLLAKRIGKHGTNTWGPPGGKVEMYEEIIPNVVRETDEEAGITIDNVRFVGFTNDATPQWGTHYLTLHFAADWQSGEPRNEEGKMIDWTWYEWDHLPEPLFAPARNFVENGYNPLNF